MTNTLGIYFGLQSINIVELKGKKVFNNILIPYLLISSGDELQEKVPNEIKMVAVLKEKLEKNKILTKEAVVNLAGRELIVRNFDMIAVPKTELSQAVNFEVKKYIPFKTEDLTYDFQAVFDRKIRRRQVLYIGIKKTVLEKYLFILEQLNLKIKAIEYSAFSLLRIVKLSGIHLKGTAGIINVDSQENDEINFFVSDNGFPLFSRDITLIPEAQALGFKETQSQEKILERLKTEIRISLDFYQRKFPTKKMSRLLFLCDAQDYTELSAFVKEAGLACELIDISKYTGKQSEFSIGFLKAYSASLYNLVRTNLKINLLAQHTVYKALDFRKGPFVKERVFSWFSKIRIRPIVPILGLLICLGVFINGTFQRKQLEDKIKEIINTRSISFKGGSQKNYGYEELATIESEYKRKINTLDRFVKPQIYVTRYLNIFARNIPDNVWLTDLSFKRTDTDNIELNLKGYAFLEDSNKELELINTFILRLKSEPDFTRSFKEIYLSSVDTEVIRDLRVTKFVIQCKG
ncbi:MAG: pilus assembly protein PilM [Candidatus Omnitrophica bacterium]|nr:pilus assembly protein PilM [Candidatus Omnitrophota bacterium]